MSASPMILPRLWATAQTSTPTNAPTKRKKPAPRPLEAYRKYTEALLRRYSHMAMEKGRVPSLLGRELFRGNVTHYTVRGFDDVVIFVHDIEHCLEALEDREFQIIERIALQEYTLEEAAALLGLPPWTVNRRYGHALDVLTEMFLKREMLEPLIGCQGAEVVDISTYH